MERLRMARLWSLAVIGLTEFARLHFDCRDVSRFYVDTVCRRTAALEKHACESSIDKVLRESVVNSFLGSLTLSPYTVKGYRGDILTVWNAAADEDLVPYPVRRRIRAVRTPQLIVECFSLEEARQILAAAHRVKGCYPNGVARRHYWDATIRLAWDTGFRLGDILKFRLDAVRADGSVQIVQSKTGRIANAILRETTIGALQLIGSDRPCEWPLTASRFGRHFAAIVKEAKVRKGTFKWLRRASGSYVEAEQPGSGHKHLGHASQDIFDRHYDAKLGGHNLPQPPEL